MCVYRGETRSAKREFGEHEQLKCQWSFLQMKLFVNCKCNLYHAVSITFPYIGENDKLRYTTLPNNLSKPLVDLPNILKFVPVSF